MNRNYIGLSCTFHDPALAIVDAQGDVVFAEATERYLQSKRAINCPPDDVNRIDKLLDEYCDPQADLVVAKTWSGRPMTYGLGQKVQSLRSWAATAFSGKAPDGSPRRFRAVANRGPVRSLTEWLVDSHVNLLLQASTNLKLRIRLQPTREFFAGWCAAPGASRVGDSPGARELLLTQFDHHLTHAAAACFSSPYRQAVCAVIDGYGEFTTTGYYAYADGKLDKLDVPQKSPGSLGFLYAFLCMACGFDPIKGEEWKVMGLAPYGRFDSRIHDLLESLYAVDGLRIVHGHRMSELKRRVSQLGPYDIADLACTGQRIFEERMEQVLCNLAELGISENLVLSGGCALNSSMNGQILERTPFKNLFVNCAPGDDGNAVGAALLAHRRDHPDVAPPCETRSPYLGSSLSRETLENLRELGRVPNHSSWPGRIHEKAASLLAQGKIVGWVQGRAEFGPRALGNRSILADPRQAGMKDRLNDRVKFREEFRPFAPAILHEFGPDYFEDYQESPYMERTLRFRGEAIDKVPAVVHVNRTGRLQTVKREWNERFYRLIEEFHRITGVPVLLNTSFNVMGKPIIHSVEDALAVFYTSGLDALILEDELIEK